MQGRTLNMSGELCDVQHGLKRCTLILSVRFLASKVTGGAPVTAQLPLRRGFCSKERGEQALGVFTFITPRNFIL